MRNPIKNLGGTVVLSALLASMPISAGFVPHAAAHGDMSTVEIEILVGDYNFQLPQQEENGTIHFMVDTEYLVTFKNVGEVEHEAHFGWEPVKKDDIYVRYGSELMPGFLGAHVESGESGTIHIRFREDDIGEWELGCFMPGHYEMGQRAPVLIEEKGHH